MAQSQWPLINYVYHLMEYLICKEFSPSDIAINVLISLIHFLKTMIQGFACSPMAALPQSRIALRAKKRQGKGVNRQGNDP
jgi:hypothetical protein